MAWLTKLLFMCLAAAEDVACIKDSSLTASWGLLKTNSWFGLGPNNGLSYKSASAADRSGQFLIGSSTPGADAVAVAVVVAVAVAVADAVAVAVAV